MDTFDAHEAEAHKPEQAPPSAGNAQAQAEFEALLSSENLTYGYVYQDDRRTEYMFQGTPENIAYFIGSRPYVDEMIVTDAAGWPILNTFGYFIDKCPDQELLAEIKKTLIPIQTGEAQAQPFFCPTVEAMDEYCAQRDPLDQDLDGPTDSDMDMDMGIDPDLGF